MKNFARLILFFSLSFIILYIIAILFGVLSSWIDAARIVPLSERPGGDPMEIAWRVLPIVLYLSILLSLSYSVRGDTSTPVSIITIIVLAVIFTAGGSLGLSRTGFLKPALRPVAPVQARPGLVLSQRDNIMVLLRESSDIRGPRVVSLPGQPLIYQEKPIGPNNTILNLPDLPFSDETPWFVHSLNIDFSLSAREIKNRLDENYYSYFAYIFSLILLLAALRFIMELSQWHLANLFLGALVFRLVLTLETFLNMREINVLIGSFLTEKVPAMLITPLVFCALGILVIIYTLLTRIARKVGPWSKGGRNE